MVRSRLSFRIGGAALWGSVLFRLCNLFLMGLDGFVRSSAIVPMDFPRFFAKQERFENE